MPPVADDDEVGAASSVGPTKEGMRTGQSVISLEIECERERRWKREKGRRGQNKKRTSKVLQLIRLPLCQPNHALREPRQFRHADSIALSADSGFNLIQQRNIPILGVVRGSSSAGGDERLDLEVDDSVRVLRGERGEFVEVGREEGEGADLFDYVSVGGWGTEEGEEREG